MNQLSIGFPTYYRVIFALVDEGTERSGFRNMLLFSFLHLVFEIAVLNCMYDAFGHVIDVFPVFW